MIRRIIQIDGERCNGCGACARACHEGAIGMVNGRAQLLRDDYCDGLGDCLPACPVDAIRFIEREAAPYDEAAVLANRAKKASAEVTDAAQAQAAQEKAAPCGCAGSAPRDLRRGGEAMRGEGRSDACDGLDAPGRLGNWPVQIQLAPVRAPYFDGANLLVAADCTAYAFGAFHEKFIHGRTVLIACPKLDGVNYAEKLSAILQSNDVRSVTLTRMQVPCCGGLEHMLREALKNSGRALPLRVVVIGMDGRIVSDTGD